MQKQNLSVVRPIGLVLVALLCMIGDSFAQTPVEASQIQTAELDHKIRDFLQKEVTAHVADIKTLDPPPERVVGALTIGEFSWGTFMRTLGSYSEFAGTTTIAGHDVPSMIGKMAKIELDHGGKTWAQHAAMALRKPGGFEHVPCGRVNFRRAKTYIALLIGTIL
jgi:hypothetical protein